MEGSTPSNPWDFEGPVGRRSRSVGKGEDSKPHLSLFTFQGTEVQDRALGHEGASVKKRQPGALAPRTAPVAGNGARSSAKVKKHLTLPTDLHVGYLLGPTFWDETDETVVVLEMYQKTRWSPRTRMQTHMSIHCV